MSSKAEVQMLIFRRIFAGLVVFIKEDKKFSRLERVGEKSNMVIRWYVSE